MICFPNIKINLGLRITRKREDGYHDLDTVFYPLPLRDMLEMVPSEKLQLFSTGLNPEVLPEHNLVWKAYQLLRKDFPEMPNVHIHLHKVIPSGAGLGGGSSDASFALRLLNDMVPLNLTQEQLLAYALKLGSDCPFFIINEPCYAVSRGEILKPIPLDLKNYFFVLVKPDRHISTAQAFHGVVPQHLNHTSAEIVTKPIRYWKEELVNDFEISTFHHFPELRKIKEDLYRMGAVYASMSGSGSTFYGIFETKPELHESIQGHQIYVLNPAHS